MVKLILIKFTLLSVGPVLDIKFSGIPLFIVQSNSVRVARKLLLKYNNWRW
jgi:hypothetical protein